MNNIYYKLVWRYHVEMGAENADEFLPGRDTHNVDELMQILWRVDTGNTIKMRLTNKVWDNMKNFVGVKTLCNKIIFSSWILFLMIYQSWLFQRKNYISVTTKKLRIPPCTLDVSESVCKETSKSIFWRCQTNISADLLVLVIIFCKKGKKIQK